MTVLFARAGGGNWSAAATWSLTSGGGATGSVPTAADECRLDAASGAVTIDAGATRLCRQLDCLGYTGTLTHATGTQLSIGDGTAGSGNRALRLVAGMTYTLGNVSSSSISFLSTSATQQTIDFAGKSHGNINFNGVNGSWLQASAMTSSQTAVTVTLTAGTWTTGNFAITTAVLALGPGSSTRVWTPGSSAINLGFGAGAFNCSNATGLTVSANTAVVTFTNNAASISSAAVNYNGLSLVFSACSTPAITANGAFTIANLTNAGKAAGSVMTVSGPFNLTGVMTMNAPNATTSRTFVISSSFTTPRTITMTGATIHNTNVDYRDIVIAGSPTVGTTVSVGDAGGNTGITFTAQVTRFAVVAGLLSLTATWSATSGGAGGASVPLCHDIVNFNAASAAGTYTMDLLRIGGIDFTGFTRTFASANGWEIYGSLTLASGMALTALNTLTFRGRGSFNLTTAGIVIPHVLAFSGGITTLQDDLTTSVNTAGAIGVNQAGTLVDNGKTVNMLGASSTVTFGSAIGAFATLSGVWNLYATSGSVFNASVGCTMVCDALVINIMSTSASVRTINLVNNFNYGAINYVLSGSTGGLIITGQSNVGLIEFHDAANVRTLTLPTSSGITIVNDLKVEGTPGKLMTLIGDVIKADGEVSLDFVDIQNSDATGGAQFYAGDNSVDGGTNTGWLFNSPLAPFGFMQGALLELAKEYLPIEFVEIVSVDEDGELSIDYAPITVFGAPGNIAGILDGPTSSGHLRDIVSVLNMDYEPGSSAWGCTVNGDKVIMGVLNSSGNSVTGSYIRPTINVYDPVNNIFKSHIITTDLGYTPIGLSGFVISDFYALTDLGDGRAIALNTIQSAGWPIVDYGDHPVWVEFVDGEITHAVTAAQMVALSPTLGPQAYPLTTNGAGQTFYQARGQDDCDVLPNGWVIISNYFTGGSSNSGGLTVIDPSVPGAPVIMGYYQFPDMTMHDATTDGYYAPKFVDCDPTSSLSDMRVAVTIDYLKQGGGTGLPFPFQEVAVDGSGTITPVSAPIFPTSHDQTTNIRDFTGSFSHAKFDDDGNLWASTATKGTFHQKAMSCFLKSGGERSYIATNPASAGWQNAVGGIRSVPDFQVGNTAVDSANCTGLFFIDGNLINTGFGGQVFPFLLNNPLVLGASIKTNSDFTSDVTGWTNFGISGTLTWEATDGGRAKQMADGDTVSLVMQSDGNTTYSDLPEAAAGQSIVVRADIKSIATVRRARASIAFYDSADVNVGSFTGPYINTVVGSYIVMTCPCQVPPNAVKYKMFITINDVGGGILPLNETHVHSKVVITMAPVQALRVAVIDVSNFPIDPAEVRWPNANGGSSCVDDVGGLWLVLRAGENSGTPQPAYTPNYLIRLDSESLLDESIAA